MMPVSEAFYRPKVAVGNVFKRGAWWQRLAGGRRDFTFGICAPPLPSLIPRSSNLLGCMLLTVPSSVTHCLRLSCVRMLLQLMAPHVRESCWERLTRAACCSKILHTASHSPGF